jgi:hypothetical protein
LPGHRIFAVGGWLERKWGQLLNHREFPSVLTIDSSAIGVAIFRTLNEECETNRFFAGRDYDAL